MAVVRRSTHELAQEVRFELNRPNEDDLLDFPDSYYRALTKAHTHIRRLVATRVPQVLSDSGPYLVVTADNGASYDLEDTFIGPIGVYQPPGPPSGIRVLPALPEQDRAGYWIEGTKLHLTREHEYNPGLYVTGVKHTAPDMDADTDHTLPEYCEQALIYRAAFELARLPGMMVNADDFRSRFNEEWHGDRNNPSDTGILGILAKRSDYEGIETAVSEYESGAWWRGIGS